MKLSVRLIYDFHKSWCLAPVLLGSVVLASAALWQIPPRQIPLRQQGGRNAFAFPDYPSKATFGEDRRSRKSALLRQDSFESAGMACVSCHSPETGYSYPIPGRTGIAPGIVSGRFGDRRPPSIAYAAYLPTGIPHYDVKVGAYVGGLFWDGRVTDAYSQAKVPFRSPNEMNNCGRGIETVSFIVKKIKKGSCAARFIDAFGPGVFKQPAAKVYELAAKAIVAFEKSNQVAPFTSKYDAWRMGKATLTDEELLGMRLATGTMNGRPDGFPFRKLAHCTDCHSVSADYRTGPDIFTNSCYANLGVPRNLKNPYYKSIDAKLNPDGYNHEGDAYVDLGLGAFLYPALGLPPGDLAEGDPLHINGAFKAPSLRNVDKRPFPGFEKSYMHNGAFKSLKEVVHFYNSRNLTTVPGEIIDFTKPDPYKGLKGKPFFLGRSFCHPIRWLMQPASRRWRGRGADRLVSYRRWMQSRSGICI